MGSLSWDEAQFLMRVVRDTSLGATFGDRFEALGEDLLALVPGVGLSAMVLGSDREPGLQRSYFRNHDPGLLDDYLAHYQTSDPMGASIAQARGEPIALSDCVVPGRFGSDPYTGELLPRLQIEHVLGLSLRLPDGKTLALAIQREGGQGDFSRKERQLLRLVGPELARAAVGVLLRERVAHLADTEVDHRAGGVLISERGGIEEIDVGARSLIAKHPDVLTTQLFEAVVARALAEPTDVLCSSVEVVPGQDSTAIRITLTELENARTDDSREFFLVIEHLVPPSVDSFETVADKHSLTSRERQVARLAVAGHGNRGIAHHLGISPVTVGVHLGRIYKKVHVAGRVDLARVMSQGQR